MNTLVLLAMLCVAQPSDPIIEPPPSLIEAPPVKVVPRTSYKLEDFHVYDESSRLHGLPLASKLFVLLPTDEDKRLFLAFGDKLPKMVDFSTVVIGYNKELKGYVLIFEDRASTLKALNDCLKEGYNVYPIVIYEDIEMAVPNEIIVEVHASVKKSDYMRRLNKVAEGKFNLYEIESKTFSLTFKDLINPSNVLVLSNLITKDSFWVNSAMPAFLPMNGYIRAKATIETSSYTNLGQERILKIDIDVFDPKINVKVDMLPQLGVTFAPVPNMGENWMDIKPPVITQTKTGTKRTISVSYPFRYLRYGRFAFQSIPIPYEKNGHVLQTKTNTCEFGTNSVITGTDIEDLQLESYSASLVQLPFVKQETTDDYLSVILGDAKLIIPAILGVTGVTLILFWLNSLIAMLSGLFVTNVNEVLWDDLDACLDLDFDNWAHDYGLVSSRLNKVLIGSFGVALHAISQDICNDNFSKLLSELNKLYMPETHVEAEPEVLIHALTNFCYERKYD